MDKRYLTYELEDFLDDAKFIQWARLDNPASDHPISVWLKEHPEKLQIVSKAKKLLHTIKFKNIEPNKELENKVWASILEKTSGADSEIKISHKRKSILLRLIPYAAAAAGLALILYFQLKPHYTSVSADAGQLVAIDLPDASKVSLNASSKIRYLGKEFENSRTLSLEGEAFFEVEKGGSFVVETEVGHVEVLGTSFNVRTWDEVLEVKVYSGTVKVSTVDGQKSIILTANEAVALDERRNFEESMFQGESKAVWLQGFMEFENSTLEEVFKAIERQFKVVIEADQKTLSRIYQGPVRNTVLDSALKDLKFAMNLKTRFVGSKIIISPAD